DLVACIDARGARNALELQPIANVDAGRARLHAHLAVDAVAEAAAAWIDCSRPRAARLAAGRIVGDDERVAVEHRALEARIRAHVLAHLFAHVAGVAIGREAVEQHPEPFPAAQRQRREAVGELVDRCEVTDEGETRVERERDPKCLLGRLAQNLVGVPRSAVELHALLTVAFRPALHPHEYLRPHSLRTGVAAPQEPCERREEKEGQRGDDEQPCEQEEVLREERQAEDVELARRQVEQYRLPSAPLDPRHQVEQTQQRNDRYHAQAIESTLDLTRIDFAMRCVKSGRRRFFEYSVYNERSVEGSVMRGSSRNAVRALESAHINQKKKNPRA